MQQQVNNITHKYNYMF